MADGLRATVALLRVELTEIQPPIWRQVLVPHAITLTALHGVLQTVMGWENAHLWEFRTDERSYGEPDPNWPVEWLQRATGVRLRQIAPAEGSVLEYVYDYGDDWVHPVRLEALLPNLLPSRFGGAAAEVPFCLAGERACPPEDSGGPHGYSDLVAALRGEAPPSDPELSLEDLRRWAGADFDPETFSARQVNRELRLVSEL